MGSQREKGGAARLPELSRRAVITGTSIMALGVPMSSAPLPAAASAAHDEVTERCKQWLAVNAEIERLQARWAKLESWLVREHSWFQLSPAEKQALPKARELCDIQGCLDRLTEQRGRLLEAIPASGPPSLEAVITRLTVVERLIWADDYPEVHPLITKAHQDLIALSCDGPSGMFSG